jgi:hypothetical protein
MVTGARGMLVCGLEQVVCDNPPDVISFKFVDIEEAS